MNPLPLGEGGATASGLTRPGEGFKSYIESSEGEGFLLSSGNFYPIHGASV